LQHGFPLHLPPSQQHKRSPDVGGKQRQRQCSGAGRRRPEAVRTSPESTARRRTKEQMREQSSRWIGAGGRPSARMGSFLVSIYIIKWADPFNFDPIGKAAKGKEKAQQSPAVCFFFHETPSGPTRRWLMIAWVCFWGTSAGGRYGGRQTSPYWWLRHWLFGGIGRHKATCDYLEKPEGARAGLGPGRGHKPP
jgi:hypothetical protein